MDEITKQLEDLGYNEFFESSRKELGLDHVQIARVVSESRGAYKVKDQNGEYLAKITGKHMFHASSREDYPAVGDWVAITVLEPGHAVINSILPRRTMIKRTYGDRNRSGEKNTTQIIATNIDIAFLVESVDRDFSLNRLERYCSIAESGGVIPAIILNKIDLISQEELDEKLTLLKNRFPGMDITTTSTLNNEGLDTLKRYITRGKTYCFLGSSGVGKSSLINLLIGENAVKTGEIGTRSGRGKHTTTARHTYILTQGGILIDNPGIREVGMTDMSEGIAGFFDEITTLARQCRYSDCTHIHEPGCAVLKAVKSGGLDEQQYANYIAIKKESDYYEMNEVQKRNKDRQFGKFMKKAKKDLKSHKHKFYGD